MRIALAVLAVAALASCADRPRADDASGDVVAWTTRLEAIAKTYEAFGRVDDVARWAPTLCRMPNPPRLRESAPSGAPHGGKLYSIWAKDSRAYAALSGHDFANPMAATEAPASEGCSQVLVKEAFHAVKDESPAPGGRHVLGPAVKDGVAYRAGEPAGLFVMFRLDPATPGTDDGWVYGTVSKEGAVTAVGRVQSCAECHASAPHGRVFGLPKDAPVSSAR